MNTLPKDIIIELSLFLEPKDVLALSTTAKRYNLMDNENFWRRKMIADRYEDKFNLSTYKHKYQIAFDDYMLILFEFERYINEVLGNFAKYIDLEKYRNDYIKNMYNLRNKILSGEIKKEDDFYNLDKNKYKNIYNLFPKIHHEVFDDFDDEYIFNGMEILLHREFEEDEEENHNFCECEECKRLEIEENKSVLNVVLITNGIFIEISHGFIVAQTKEGMVVTF